ncbi:MAG: septum site-determining protein MinC [bacterium]
MDSEANGVYFKGTGQGIVISFDDSISIGAAKRELIRKLAISNDFFAGARVILDVGKRSLHHKDVQALKDILVVQNRLNLLRVICEDETTKHFFAEAGLNTEELPHTTPPRTRSVPSESIYLDAPTPAAVEAERTLLIRRTIRSGQTISFDGNIVVMGDVNPGATLIASGDVIVWGKMRGIAHAGAGGKESAFISALRLEPMQLRIASLISRSPDNAPKPKGAEKAYIKDGRIVIEDIAI